MPITLGSSGITFSNGTSQTTAMPADKGKPISITSFTSSGTYTVPSGCTMILVQLVGGGGGSAGAAGSLGAVRRLIARTTRNSAKATIMKLIIALMKRP